MNYPDEWVIFFTLQTMLIGSNHLTHGQCQAGDCSRGPESLENSTEEHIHCSINREFNLEEHFHKDIKCLVWNRDTQD